MNLFKTSQKFVSKKKLLLNVIYLFKVIKKKKLYINIVTIVFYKQKKGLENIENHLNVTKFNNKK